MVEKWIIPCNLKQFDIINHFKDNQTAVWKNSFSIKQGDILYLYLSSPYSEIKFKCEVISDTVTENLLTENPYAIVEKKSNSFYSKKIKYIQFKKIAEYPDGTFKLQELRNHGLGQVQIQARTDRKLQSYLDSVEHMIIERG